MQKTIFSVLLFAALLFFSGCGNTPDEAGTTASPENHAQENSRTGSDAPGEASFAGQSLRIAVRTHDERFYYLVRQFRELHPDAEIIINNFDCDPEKYQQQVSTQLMAGTGDDLIDATGFLELSMLDSGLFADIYPLMRNDPDFNEDDYYMNVFEAMSSGGKLYQFPVLFFYDLIGVNNTFAPELAEQFRQYDTISYRQLITLYDSLADPGGRELCRDVDAYTALYNNINTFIDLENKTCDFQTPEFIALISEAKAATDPEKIRRGELGYTYGWSIEAGRTFAQTLAEQAQKELFFRNQSGLIELYIPGLFDEIFTHFIPLTDERGKIGMTPLDSYLINNASENKDLAWEFLKYLTTAAYEDPWNTDGFYVNKAAFQQNVIACSKTWENFSQQLAGYSIDIDEAAVAAQIIETLDHYNSLPMTNKFAAASILPDIYMPLIQSFYDGRMTAEQVASELQNKVSLYLME